MAAVNARSNILHDYANWTYQLQLWAITKTDFNKISQGNITPGSEKSILSAGKCLISNGGFSKTDSAKRASEFPTDFAIDNLDVETIVGNKGPNARGTDAIRINFEIIEPYSVTLINRLITLSSNGSFAGQKDFKTLIYCMVINFYGYDDFGKPKLVDKASKFIPFVMINMQFQVTNKGAVYKIEGIPQQSVALSSLDNTVPFHVELEGQTIEELFNGTLAAKAGADTSRTDTAGAKTSSTKTITRGIGDALKDWEKYKVEQIGSQTIENQYIFKFDEELLKTKIVDTKNLPGSVFTMPSISKQNGVGTQNKSQGQTGTLPVDKETRAVRSQAGTKITDLIWSIMMTTAFMKDQVAGTGQAPSKDKPFVGIKIIPSIELLAYDPKTNYYARKVTYTIKKYTYEGEDHEKINQAPLPPDQVVKNYDYIFTGKNKDILKVNLDYKIAFFDVRNAAKANTTIADPSKVGIDPESTPKRDDTVDRDTKPFRAGRHLVATMQNSETGEASTNEKSISLAEMVSKLFDNGVDLLRLDIEIIGDPDWLQQDNLLYGTAGGNAKVLSNGAINYQTGVTCFKFNFKSPTTDYDSVTGMFNVTNADTASFSGIYQVIRVKSRFSKGRFTQNLDNVRLRNQSTVTTSTAIRTDTAQTRLVTAGTTV